MPVGRAPMRKSDPNASARNPRESSAAENCVYCGGAPSNAPNGAGCWPDAASAPVIMMSRVQKAASNRCITVSSLPTLADQALLCHRSDQCAITGEYKSARETARAVQIGRILRIEQPFIGPKWPVQPQRVVETSGHEFFLEQCASVRRERRVEQHHVGSISEHALMDGRKIRQFSRRANPDVDF